MIDAKYWVLDRLKEPSTWKGLSLLVGILGVHLHPELLPQIGTVVGTVISAIEVARQEK